MALPAESMRRRDEPPRARLRPDVRARAGLPAASASRAPRRRHHLGVLPSVPSPEGMARVPRPRRRPVPRRHREEPRRGRAPVPARADDGGLRGDGRASAAFDRADQARACRRGPERTQPAARQGDPGRRPGVSLVRADRRRCVASAVFRQFPHDARRRAGADGGGTGTRRAARQGVDVSEELLPAERKVLEAVGDRPLDFRAMWAVSNLFRSATAVRRHMEATVLAADQISWTSFVGLWVLWVWGELGANAFAEAVGISKPTATGVLKTLEGRGWATRRPDPADGRSVIVTLTSSGRATIEQL